ncbi:hypothetical protein [Vineibacter terrae]|uniref:hypothetical protein n=1 Tax=Vineibacter terrae TaxID=2586908 RepID=UPI002E3338FC|nr:hypothetical protein [Vineibacter terrae]HEX2887183.1 hypothetical protein [Vineibacter terrae]
MSDEMILVPAQPQNRPKAITAGGDGDSWTCMATQAPSEDMRIWKVVQAASRMPLHMVSATSPDKE